MKVRNLKRRYSGRFYFTRFWRPRLWPRPYDWCNPRALGV